MLIEAELIRLHQPQFNVLLKDDKSPIYIRITRPPFSKPELVRKRDLNVQQPKGVILGPFSSTTKLKQVLKLARKIFPWCDKAQARMRKKTSSKPEELEPAELEKKLQSFHQACFYYHLELCPGACVGKISIQEYQQNIDQLILFLRGQKKQVLQNLEEKMQHLAAELKFEQAQKIKFKISLIKDITNQKYRLKPDLILPALHDSAQQNALDHLRRILADYGLIPRRYQLKRIEGFDVSNLMGQSPAVSMVVFSQASPDKKNYRLFNIRNLNQPNDTAMLKQAIARRQNHPEWGRPDLIIVDGGKAQIRAALSIWEKQTPVIGIAKNPDRLILPLKHYRDQQSNRLKIKYQIIKLPSDHPTLHLIQNVRDEAHRFAKKQHTRLRRKKLKNSK